METEKQIESTNPFPDSLPDYVWDEFVAEGRE
jgi:hypothetical protein